MTMTGGVRRGNIGGLGKKKTPKNTQKTAKIREKAAKNSQKFAKIRKN
jgi:hypothetical protein